jgi:hypothetical protein
MGTLERRIHPIPVSLVPKAAGFSVVEGALGVEPARCGLSEACPPSCDCGLELRVRFGAVVRAVLDHRRDAVAGVIF